MENNDVVNKPLQPGTGTVGEVRRAEADVLYGLVLMFTYGQLGLVVWDLLMQLPGLALLLHVKDAGAVHSFGELTTAYLGFLAAYIGRNAWLKYSGKEDAEQAPSYVILRIKRGYFYLGLWGTLSFVAYMLKGMAVINRLPYELVITTAGVAAALLGDKAIKGFLDKRAAGQLLAADTAASKHDTIMGYVAAHQKITNKECRQVTGLSEAHVTRQFDALVKEGRLRRQGEGRGVYYEKA
jgi:hypothetical protein